MLKITVKSILVAAWLSLLIASWLITSSIANTDKQDPPVSVSRTSVKTTMHSDGNIYLFTNHEYGIKMPSVA